MGASLSPRHWLNPLTTVFFAAVGVTGILMWVHVRVPGVKLLHEVAGLLFVTAAVVHVILNWRPLCACFRRRAAWSTLLAGILVCTALAAIDLARGVEREGGREGGHRRLPGHYESQR